jgi:hypothetical protein
MTTPFLVTTLRAVVRLVSDELPFLSTADRGLDSLLPLLEDGDDSDKRPVFWACARGLLLRRLLSGGMFISSLCEWAASSARCL